MTENMRAALTGEEQWAVAQGLRDGRWWAGIISRLCDELAQAVAEGEARGYNRALDDVDAVCVYTPYMGDVKHGMPEQAWTRLRARYPRPPEPAKGERTI